MPFYFGRKSHNWANRVYVQWVRLSPDSDGSADIPDGQLCANSRPEQVQQRAWTKLRLVNDLIGEREQPVRHG
jgi:hypothetical protein